MRLKGAPSCEPPCKDDNLECGRFNVVNQASSTRAYDLELRNEIGPSKILDSFIWDPG